MPGQTIEVGGSSLGSTVEVSEIESLADGEFIVGDGTGAPAKESGATARTSLGLGTGDSPTFTAVTAAANSTTQPTFIVAGSNTGLGQVSSNLLLFVSGAVKFLSAGAGSRVPSNAYIGWDSATSGIAGGDAFFSRKAAAAIHLGAADAASPVAQTLGVQGSRSGTDTDTAGASFTVRPGIGTGNATAASLILQGMTVQATGTTAHSPTTLIELKGVAMGFYGATPVAQQTGVAVTAAAIHAALVALGLITA